MVTCATIVPLSGWNLSQRGDAERRDLVQGALEFTVLLALQTAHTGRRVV